MNTFARRVGVEFYGDEAALERSFASVAATTKEYGDLSVSTSEKVAKARVLATAKSIQALREDVAFFRAATESQIKGSDLQIASANRLAAAQKRLAVVTGEAASATGESVAKSTDAQIAGTVRLIEALRAEQAEFAAVATSGVRSAKEQEAAQIRLAAVSRRLAAVTGESTAATAAFAGGARTAERDLGKTTRGVVAASGVFGRFSRSLAFASSGFIAAAAGTTLIRDSIKAAEGLAKAQASLSVAIRHTGGDLAKLQPEYTATAKAAARFGVSQVDATTGLARATVLTGNAAAAQRAYQEALVISKATGKDFNAVLTATAKGQEGVTTSLRRYGILVKTGESGTAQFTQVMARFGGQAAANTTATDRLKAVFANTEAVIGQQLLPTFERLAGSLAAWLTKMNETGRLQKDVNGIMQAAGEVFRVLGRTIGIVDKVTGSFKHTLELLAAFKLASLVSGWVGSLELLAAKWGLVTTAAEAAQAAEARALAGGIIPKAGPGVVPLPLPAAAPGPASAVGVEEGVAAGAGGAALIAKLRAQGGVILKAGEEVASSAFKFGRFAKLGVATFAAGGAGVETGKVRVNDQGFAEMSFGGKWFRGNFVGIPGTAVITPQLRNFPKTGQILPPSLRIPGLTPPLKPAFQSGPATGQAGQGPFGTAKPIPVYKSFSLTAPEQLAQARAALTRSNADDVAAAKAVIARIKRLIDQGHLAGQSLIQALQAEGSALSTLWSAEDAAAQKRAAAAQAAKARIQARLQDSIDPLKLEIALSRAQAFGQPIVPRLKALLAAAQNALAKGLTGALEKQALDQITSLKQQIKDAATTATVTFVPSAKLQLALAKDQALGISPVDDLLKLKAAILLFIRTHKHNTAALIDAYNQLGAVTQQLASSFTLSPKLQLALARDAALGLDTTKDLLKAKAAILNFIKHHRHNIAALTDAYNQLAAINQQLGSTAASALGLFKQASTKALTAGLNLTAAQRKALRARLSQLGPGGTVPGSGTGAAGYAINPKTGRPFAANVKVAKAAKIKTPGQPRHLQAAGMQPIDIRENFNFTVKLDGDVLGRHQVRYQQRHKRRNPPQRRGANAGG